MSALFLSDLDDAQGAIDDEQRRELLAQRTPRHEEPAIIITTSGILLDPEWILEHAAVLA